ncbi:NAD-binding protein [Methanobrevibacter sp.]
MSLKSDIISKIKNDKFIIIGLLLIGVLIIYGVIGSIILMKLNLVDALYYTIITIATVGYGDITPLTPLEKIFSITLSLAGIGIIAYIFSTIFENVSNNIKIRRRQMKMNKKMKNMTDHYILCGYGRVGNVVLNELIKRKQKVIVIDDNKETIEKLNEEENISQNPDILTITGDATSQKIMNKFKIDESNGLILTTGSDVTNLFIVLSIRDISPNAWIVSRASKEENIKRLHDAGANKVISPETSGGLDLFLSAVKPNLVRITDINITENLEERISIVLKHECTIESIEFHFPGIEKPFNIDVGFKKEKDLVKFLETHEKSEIKHTLDSMTLLSQGIHSHLISGPNSQAIDNVIKELKANNLVTGVDLTNKEILNMNRQTMEKILNEKD